MLVLLTALILGVCVGYLSGGRLHNLEQLGLRRPWLVLASLGMQLLAFSPPGAALGQTPTIVLHVASYAPLVWFVVLNRRRRGIVVAGAGMGLNLLAIVLNGGHMPASRSALVQAGVEFSGATHNNSGVIGAGTHLGFLGDLFAAPGWMQAANVFSVGDVLIVLGVAALLVACMRAPVQPRQAT